MDMEKTLLGFCGSEGLIVSSPYEFTIFRNHVKGGSFIDLCLCDSSVCNMLSNSFADKEVELFTGAPSVGLWPICNDLNITKPLKHSKVRHDLLFINWDYLFASMEMEVTENFDVLINQ